MTADEVADELVSAAPDAGLLLDFDGTLAPIVDDPDEARPAPGMAPVLRRLAESLALVAIVSGRPATFVAEQLPLDGVRLLGVYGLEEWHDGAVHPHPDAVAWHDTVREARDELRGTVGRRPGVRVEDKGLAVAVHWRNAEDRVEAASAVERAVGELASRTGLVREPGKLVAELRPPLQVDKGTAVRGVVGDGLRAVAYLGDDLGDLAAFNAVRELGGRCVAVRHGAETPVDLLEAADAVLDGPTAVAAWLARLADALAG